MYDQKSYNRFELEHAYIQGKLYLFYFNEKGKRVLVDWENSSSTGLDITY
jgi:hypothetical protein